MSENKAPNEGGASMVDVRSTVKQAVSALIIVAIVLAVAFLFDVARFPLPVMGALVAIVVIALAIALVNPHVVRTRAGRGLVYHIHGIHSASGRGHRQLVYLCLFHLFNHLFLPNEFLVFRSFFPTV